MKATESVQNYKAKAKECVNYSVRQVKNICTQIGPRESGEESERKAQEYMADELKKYSDEVHLEEFSLHPKAFMGWVLIVGFCMLANVALFNVGVFYNNVTVALVGLILVLIGSVCMIAEFLMYRQFLDPFFPKRTSANVVAVRAPKGEVKQRIIFNGHCDSAYEWRYTYLGGGHCLVAVIAIAIVGLVAAIIGSILAVLNGYNVVELPEKFLKALAIVQICWIPSYISVLFFTHWSLVVKGANDNLTGCTNAMAVMKYLSDNDIRFENTEVRTVLTGAEEAGLRGAKAYAKEHYDECMAVDTVFLGFDTMRDYDDMAIYSRDMTGTVKNDIRVCNLMKKAGEYAGLDLPFKSVFFGSSDAAAISQAGIPGATFAAMDPTPARYYHTRLDTEENLDPKTIEAAINLSLETVFLFDEQGLKDTY